MRTGGTIASGEWSVSPLRLFAGDRIQVQHEEGTWATGVLQIVPGGIEIVYDEPRPIGGYVESSCLLPRRDAKKLRTLLRPETLWTDAVRERREEQIWRAAHPPLTNRLARWTRELVGRDPISSEPLLGRYVGRPVVIELQGSASRMIYASGVLLTFDREFLALADVALPAETSLPLCPGRTTSADLDVLWNDEGLELFNRGSTPVQILGIRTADGLMPWELSIRSGFRERHSFRKAPAGTAELVFESPVKGDAILSREAVRVRGGSEGTISIPALPDLETPMRELTGGVRDARDPRPEELITQE